MQYINPVNITVSYESERISCCKKGRRMVGRDLFFVGLDEGVRKRIKNETSRK